MTKKDKERELKKKLLKGVINGEELNLLNKISETYILPFKKEKLIY